MTDPVPTTAPDPQDDRTPSNRLLTVFLVIVFAAAVAGICVGIGGHQPAWDRTAQPAPVPVGAALPAVPYWQMDGKSRGPNRDYHSSLTTLVSPAPAATDPVVQTPEQKQAALALRASRRAYAGAPPTIPHPVNGNDVVSCYACHGDGKLIDGIIAPKISHQRFTNCTQCHAQAGTKVPGSDEGFAVENQFVGLASPTNGQRAWAGAPPTMPHSVHMRENCTSCHGTLGRPGLRSTHPWRVNCVQCHAQSAELNHTAFMSLHDGPPGSTTPGAVDGH